MTNAMQAAMSEKGWFLHRTRSAPPVQFQVFGERGCGTNLLRKLMEKAWRIERTEKLGWKHAFPHMVAIPERCLVVCIQRDALGWATSLYKRPWHGSVPMQQLSFDRFIRAEWQSIVDRPSDFEMLDAELDAKGAALQYDRHPIRGTPFRNIFEMRNLKSEALLGMRARGCDVAYVQLEALQADERGLITGLGEALGLEPTERGYRPVKRRMGNNFNPSVRNRPPPPEAWSDTDRAFALLSLDQQTEAAWGYHYAP